MSAGFSIPNVSDVDPKKLSPLYGGKGNSNPDFIPTPGRRGRDDVSRLFFNTGAFWLLGFGTGGSYGFVEGLRTAVNPSFRIKVNSVLNSLYKRGSLLGNSLGIIGKYKLMLNLLNSKIFAAFVHSSCVAFADLGDLDGITGTTYMTPTVAGVITGSVFVASRGARAMALGGIIGGGASCFVWYGGSYAYNMMLGSKSRRF